MLVLCGMHTLSYKEKKSTKVQVSKLKILQLLRVFSSFTEGFRKKNKKTAPCICLAKEKWKGGTVTKIRWALQHAFISIFCFLS